MSEITQDEEFTHVARYKYKYKYGCVIELLTYCSSDDKYYVSNSDKKHFISPDDQDWTIAKVKNQEK